MTGWIEPLEAVAQSVRTAQSIAHANLPDHEGEPRLCSRPVCARLLADASAIDAWAERTAD